MTEKISLDMLRPGEAGRVKGLLLKADMERRLRDMGFLNGTRVECAYRSPFGDPSAYCIKGTLIAIRREDSEKILIECEKTENPQAERIYSENMPAENMPAENMPAENMSAENMHTAGKTLWRRNEKIWVRGEGE